jgi:uncharacterized repeat protein (TIGR02543 family)
VGYSGSITPCTILDDITLYAQWTAIIYSLGFDAQPGNVSLSSKNVFYDVAVGELPTPTRAGYTFGGWFTGFDGTGMEYTEETVYRMTYDITLYAQWTANTYTLNFDANGGPVKPDNMEVTYDNPVDHLPMLDRTGYYFNGWSTKQDGSGTNYFNSIPPCTILDDITLYTQWIPNTYSMGFDADGGTVSTESKEVTFGAEIGELPTPTRSGYIFGGWYTQPNGEGKEYTATTVYDTACGIPFYAKWTATTATTYTLFFDAQSGSVSPASKTVTYGAAVGTLPKPTRSSYTFVGWYTSTNGAGTPYTATTVYSVSANTTLYAKWTAATASTYLLTFDAQSGSVSPASKSVTYGAAVGAVPTPTRSGYTFGGWYTSTNGAGTLYTATTVHSTTGNLTLYAKWVAGQLPTAVAAQEVSAVKLYPNPVVNGELKIETGELKAGERVEIYSLSGTLVSAHEVSGRDGVINVSHLAAGVYLIKVGKQTAKVMVK